MSCADVECNKMSNAQKAFNPCCNGSRAITPAKRKTQRDKDLDELQRLYNPSDKDKNTDKDQRSLIQKVAEDGTSAGGRPGGTPSDPDGSGTGDSDKCKGCDKAGDVGCELRKLSCEFTSSLGESAPMAILIGALIIFIVVALK